MPIRVTVDIIVFSVKRGRLEVLLIERRNNPFKGVPALPGGFVEENESLEQAAVRELSEETNVKNVFVKQIGAYGDVKRDPRGRTISIAFIALVDSDKFELKSTEDAKNARWVFVEEAETLAFDHSKILADAIKELRYEIQTTNIAAQLMPEKFTLTELQKVYETILGTELDKRNFRKKISYLNLVVPTKMQRMEGAHRPAVLYRFRDSEYKILKDKMHVFT